MGLFDRGAQPEIRYSTIRDLVGIRLSRVPAFAGVDPRETRAQLKALTSLQVMSLPEATLVQIFETISAEPRASWPDLAARIERHRASLGTISDAALHTPVEYAVARFLLEHEDPEKGITRAWGFEAADYAASLYAIPATVRLETLQFQQRHLLRECKEWRRAAQLYLDGVTTDEEFMEQADLIMQSPIGEDDGSDGVRITR